jgi:peptide/nickel transport system permease protein
MAGWIRAFASPERSRAGRTWARRAWIGRAWIGRRAGFFLGCTLLALLAAAAVFADQLAPHDPYAQSLVRRLRPPVWEDGGSWSYVLGTDGFGRDYLARLIYGARISLAVGLGAAAIAGAIGATIGMLGGYAGGAVDRIVSYVIAARLALPSLLIALAILQAGGSGLAVVILVLGFTHWDRFAVVMRTVTRQVSRQDYIASARAVGCSPTRIVLQEIVPNVASHAIVVFTFETAQCVLATAALSFLGLGIQAPEPSWGLMMAEGRVWLTTQPWLITAAGLALMLMVLAINLVGDGLRDRLTPESRV